MMRLQGEWILLLPPAQGGGAWSGLVKKTDDEGLFPWHPLCAQAQV